MGSTILVTGVSRYVGARTARDLAACPGVDRVLGVDAVAPEFGLGDAEFVRADVRNPILGRILAQSQADVVVHLSLSTSGRSQTSRVSTKEANVLGAMQLIALCQAQQSVKHVVVKSTASLYVSGPGAPAVYTETAGVNTHAGPGYVRDAVEVESYVRALPRRRPDVGISILRFGHILGPHVRTVMTEYLNTPLVVPVPLGFDARMQFIHEDDAVGALVKAATGPPVGIVNIAADGVLTLQQALRLGRRPYVPIFTKTGRLLGSMARRSGVSGMSGEHIDYLIYGRCLDTTKMKRELGFHPRLSTRGTVEHYAHEVWGVVPRRSELDTPADMWATGQTCPVELSDTPQDVSDTQQEAAS